MQNALFDVDQRQAFLERYGWTILEPVGQDSSIRRYFRVGKNNQTAILMETVPDHSPHATPGHAMGDFIRIADWLQDIGVKAPAVFEQDTQNGYVLLEDIGRTSFKDALEASEKPQTLYPVAAQVLEHIGSKPCPLKLPDYHDSHVHKGHRRVIDWFMPLMRAQANEPQMVEGYLAAWQKIEQQLPPYKTGFIHVDYHVQNLMWLPQESGLKRCGVLDFQGAMIGPKLYDLANLLEDARTDVPSELKTILLQTLSEEERDWFRILATQFHCRVIGQFIKLALTQNKTQYLQHIPRLQNYIAQALQDPVLAPLKVFFEENGVDFTRSAPLDRLSELQAWVAPDAV